MLNKSIFTRLYDTLIFLGRQVLYKLREANIFICLEFYREQFTSLENQATQLTSQ